MSDTKLYTFCQMSVTKPCTNMGISKGLYINVTNSCNSAIRYTFDKLVLRLTEYTSYEAVNIGSEVTHHD